jgi:hypothetical protein
LTSLPGVIAVASCSNFSSAPVEVCGPDNVATTSWDVIAATNYEAAWYYASLDPIGLGALVVAEAPVGTDPDAASTGAASTVAAGVDRYFPNGCATATASGNVVTFTLNNCSGPLGLVASSGTFAATLNVVGTSVQTQLTGSNVRANGATVNLSTSGTFSVVNGRKTLQANSQSTGTGAYGNTLMHMGMYTLVWPTGTGCATINGSFSGLGDFSGTNTQVMNYLACTNTCPQSGTVVSSFNGGSVTLTFNGSSSAQCSASNGTSAGVLLNCP